MTPQEKAEDLVKKFSNYAYSNTKFDNDLFVKVLKQNSKEAALLAVDEILKSMEDVMPHPPFEKYWQQVKTEIEKL